MSGWIRSEIWLGLPMKRILLPTLFLRAASISPNMFMMEGGAEDRAKLLSLFLEEATIAPGGTTIVGVKHNFHKDGLEVVLLNPAFERIADGDEIPMDDSIALNTDLAVAAVKRMKGEANAA